jgi:hypothetical protein
VSAVSFSKANRHINSHGELVMSGCVLTEASNKLPIKLSYGSELGGSFGVDVSTKLLKASTAIGEPVGLQSTMLKRSNIS